MASIEYSIRSKDQTKAGIESAEKGIESLKTKVNNFAKILTGAFMGGAAIHAIRGIVNGLGEMENEYEKLNPEAAKMPGSITAFNFAISSMRANIGGVISSALSPLRVFFISLIDPLAEATAKITSFGKEIDSVLSQYGSAEYATNKKYTDALEKRKQLLKDITDIEKELLSLTTKQQAYANNKIVIPKGLEASEEKSYIEARELREEQDKKRSEEYSQSIETVNGKLKDAKVALEELNKWIKSAGTAVNKKSIEKITYPEAIDYRELFSMFSQKEIKIEPMPDMIPAIDYTELYQAFNAPNRQPEPVKENNDLETVLSSLSNTFSSLGVVGNILATIFNVIALAASPIYILLQVLQPLFDAFANTIMPTINELLAPFIGFLSIIGNTLGAMIMPLLALLVPILDVVAQAFVWLYNYGIRPLANACIFVFNMLYDAVAFIWNAIADAINAVLGWLGVHVRNMAYRDWNEGFLPKISMAQMKTAGTAATTSGTTTGVGASYTGAPTYYFYITNNFQPASVIDSSGTWDTFLRRVFRDGAMLEAARQGA
jgi:hypothetical protein